MIIIDHSRDSGWNECYIILKLLIPVWINYKNDYLPVSETSWSLSVSLQVHCEEWFIDIYLLLLLFLKLLLLRSGTINWWSPRKEIIRKRAKQINSQMKYKQHVQAEEKNNNFKKRREKKEGRG